jgi:hypothetical protein
MTLNLTFGSSTLAAANFAISEIPNNAELDGKLIFLPRAF